MRVIDSYKETDPNFTLRRQEERMKEEAEQLNRLRMVSWVARHFPLEHLVNVYFTYLIKICSCCWPATNQCSNELALSNHIYR
jgi:hypothetical protein